jgi:hypothetical protein
MNLIATILEPSPDGTLHVPVPEAWRKLPIRIKAELEPVESPLAAAYSAEWRSAFGSIPDAGFESPPRGDARKVEPLDA